MFGEKNPEINSKVFGELEKIEAERKLAQEKKEIKEEKPAD